MRCFLWILLAAGAIAQTKPSSPPVQTKSMAPPVSGKIAITPPVQAKVTAPAPAATAPPAASKNPPAVPHPEVPSAAKPPETFESAMAKQRASIGKQMESVRQQREMVVPWHTTTPTSDFAAVECEPIADPELTPLIDRAAMANQMEPKLIRGVIEQESGFRACATSAKGAKGLMQLMPATIDQFNVGDAFDPTQNVEAGAKYLRMLMDKYKGDVKLALAAYNAGPGTVDKTGAIPDIKETQDYVESIMQKIK